MSTITLKMGLSLNTNFHKTVGYRWYWKEETIEIIYHAQANYGCLVQINTSDLSFDNSKTDWHAARFLRVWKSTFVCRPFTFHSTMNHYDEEYRYLIESICIFPLESINDLLEWMRSRFWKPYFPNK